MAEEAPRRNDTLYEQFYSWSPLWGPIDRPLIAERWGNGLIRLQDVLLEDNVDDTIQWFPLLLRLIEVSRCFIFGCLDGWIIGNLDSMTVEVFFFSSDWLFCPPTSNCMGHRRHINHPDPIRDGLFLYIFGTRATTSHAYKIVQYSKMLSITHSSSCNSIPISSARC